MASTNGNVKKYGNNKGKENISIQDDKLDVFTSSISNQIY